jgi:DNA-directed RNA polymerase specialized sigma subunit
MAFIDDTEHFSLFKKWADSAIKQYGEFTEEEFKKHQELHVNRLSTLEEEFRDLLKKYEFGNLVYQYFIDFIVKEKRNVLASRPYFRERRANSASNIFKAIKFNDIETLKSFHVNYLFIFLISKKFDLPIEFKKIIKEIEKIRQTLVTINLPLVMNRSNIFWSRTPQSWLSFMDLIQIGTEGLISGVDKFGGDYDRMWVGVAIGRMTGNFIGNYNETMIHFYPKDKRRIYAANKFLARHIHGDYEPEDLVDSVSQALKSETDKDDLLSLISAVSIVSADSNIEGGGEDSSLSDTLSRYADSEDKRPDVQVAEMEFANKVREELKKLSIFDKKFLMLKGVDVNSFLC